MSQFRDEFISSMNQEILNLYESQKPLGNQSLINWNREVTSRLNELPIPDDKLYNYSPKQRSKVMNEVQGQQQLSYKDWLASTTQHPRKIFLSQRMTQSLN